MSKTVVKEYPQTSPPTKPKVERLHSYVSLVSTTIGVCGAVGSLFVWLAANVYVGTLELACEPTVESVVVKVYDQEGHEAVYHSKSLRLMPGKYHLEITLPDGKPRHKDVQINFNQAVQISLASSSGSAATSEPARELAQDQAASDLAKEKQHWWQFWRRKQAPAEQTPAGQIPAGQIPAGQIPAGQIPAGQIPAGQMPAGQTPAQQASTGQIPTGQIPTGQVPTGQASVEQAPAEQASESH